MIAHSHTCAAAIRSSLQTQYTCLTNVRQLDLTAHRIGIFSFESASLLQGLTKLQNLILADCELIALKSMPFLPTLQQLDLSNNRIPDSQTVHILRYRNLVRLNVAYNCIQKSESIVALRELRKLKMIDCHCNPLEKIEHYESAIFAEMAQLKILNGLYRDDKQYVEVPFYVIKDNLREKTDNKETERGRFQLKALKHSVCEAEMEKPVKNAPMRRYRERSVIEIDSDQIPKKRRMIE